MKFCRFKYKDKIYWGKVVSDSVVPLNTQSDSFPSIKNIENINVTSPIDVKNVKILVPTVPSKIVCVGRNFVEHALELGNSIPKKPLLFLKAPSAIIADGEQIVVPNQSEQVEHEAELAVVIGRSCKYLSETDNPLDYVFGYICLNDVTARDLQREDVQFTRAKSFDTFCPIGLIVETELDTTDIRITTKVNEIIKQDGRTSQMVFSVPFLIRYISNQMTLNVGDIIATGTPAGVSKLNEGDICEVEIEGIGTLRNQVVNY